MNDSWYAAAAVYRLAARTFAAEVDPPFHRALAGLCGAPWLAGADLLPATGGPEAVEALAVEYCRLFVGPRPACPPYASARAAGAPAARRIRAFLGERGLEPRPPPGAPIADHDHASVGLAVLAELCTRPPADGGYAYFRDSCLAPWLPGFLCDVERSSVCGPYGPVAGLTAAVFRDQAGW